MRLRLRRTVLHSVLITGLHLALAGAAHADAGHHGAAVLPPAGPDSVTVVGAWELTGLEPSRSGFMFTRMEVAETLLDVDDDGRLKPALARRWEVSADGLEWRFSIRQGSRFHDGSPLTAQTVLPALRRALATPGVLSLAAIRSISASFGQVVVTLERPFAPLPYLFTHSSTMVLAPSAYGADGRVRAIIGSGPYQIGAIAMPQQFDVVRFDGWAGAHPQITRARYISVSRAETRALMAQSGQADLAFALDPPSIRRLRTQQGMTLVEQALPRTTYIKLNAGHPLLRDARVRQAISLGVEREGIATALLRDRTLAATQLFPPAMPLWHQPALAPLRTDLPQARRLLAAAGWAPGADGILQRGGQRFAVRLVTFVDRPELPLVATALQEQMRQIGIAVRVVVGNSSDIPAGHRSGDFELGLAARNYGNVPDPVATLLQDFGPDGGDWGAMGWSDPALLQALAALSTAPARSDEATAVRGRASVAAVLQSALPVIPVLWYKQTLAVSKRLQGVSIDPYERSYRLSSLRWKR
jgi:peptide/nickel transport system substrate-binding protein